MTKLLSVRLVLTSHMLGDQMNHEQVRLFRRLPNGDFDGRLDIWRWAMKNAFEALSIKADYDSIRFSPGFAPLRTELHLRQLPRKHGAPAKPPEKFEAIRPGAQLSLNACIVPRQLQSWDKRPIVPPDTKDLYDALCFAGRFLGISHYHNDLNYGRFDVIDVSETKEYYRGGNSISRPDGPGLGDHPADTGD